VFAALAVSPPWFMGVDHLYSVALVVGIAESDDDAHGMFDDAVVAFAASVGLPQRVRRAVEGASHDCLAGSVSRPCQRLGSATAPKAFHWF